MRAVDVAKRARVRELLTDPAHAGKSDREIGRLACCTHYLVAVVRQEVSPDPAKVGRHLRGGFVMGERGEGVREDAALLADLATFTAADVEAAAWDMLEGLVPQVGGWQSGTAEDLYHKLHRAAEVARLAAALAARRTL